MANSIGAAAVRRATMRALLRGADRLDAQFARCEPLRARELALLRRAASASKSPRSSARRGAVAGMGGGAGGVGGVHPPQSPRQRERGLALELELERKLKNALDPNARTRREATAAGVPMAAAAAAAVGRNTARSVVRAEAKIFAEKHARAMGTALLSERDRGMAPGTGVVGDLGPPVPDLAFRVLRHLNRRATALERLVYNSESETVTENVRVRVASSFQRFEQAAKRYCFQYDVKMTNEGDRTMQLLSRRWVINDLNGAEVEVEGPGVVGAFPVLQPGQSYEYSSGTPLATPLGTQSGHFLFVSLARPCERSQDDSVTPPAKTFVIDVAPFALQKPSTDLTSSHAAAETCVHLVAERASPAGFSKARHDPSAGSASEASSAGLGQRHSTTKPAPHLRGRRVRRLRRKR